MSKSQHLTALALARAMLAGPPQANGLAARMQACLGRRWDWMAPLAQRCARLPGEHWRRLTPRSLAVLIANDAGFQAAWRAGQPPEIRRHLLGAQAQMQAAPLGLEQLLRPDWPDSASLARGLGITPAGLWRFSRPSAWQRRMPLGEQHYRYRLLTKRSGGWRLLEVPAPWLLAVQRRLLDLLLNSVPPHEAACGYAPGRSLLQHLRTHADQAVLLKFDLRDFYTTVRAGRVQALFSTLGYPEVVARELTALCTTATPEAVLQRLHEQGGLDFWRRQRLRDAHLPQGAPTSPALANLCAFGLDLRLAGLAQILGARYSRYADDLVFSGGPELARWRARIEVWVARVALEEGFALNHRKSRCEPAARRQTVCHVVVNRTPNLPRAEFDRLKAILHQCALHGPAAQNRAGHVDWRAHLQGRVAWAAQLNPAKAQRLQRLFERIVWP